MRHRSPPPLGIFLIAVFKIIKGVLFIAFAVVSLKLIDKDIGDVFLFWISKLHIDSEGRFIQNVLTHLSLIDNKMLLEISLATFGFALLLLVEGGGLFLEKLWAEYIVIIETGFFIPFEIYEITRHMTWTKIILFLVNTAVVLYLILRMAGKNADGYADK